MLYQIPALISVLPALAYAVSLNDFPPRLTDLPTACMSVYTQQIDGCKPSDFASGKSCSTACVYGLDDLTRPILRNCKGISGQNIIAAFLAGDGPNSVCTNANAVLSSGGDSGRQSSSSASSTTSRASETSHATSEEASSSTKASSIHVSSSSISDTVTAILTSTVPEGTSSTTATPVEVSGTATASSIATTTSGLLVDTSSAPSGAHTQAATASHTTELSPQESLMKDGSGGGSPFDSAGNLSNSAGKSFTFGTSMPITITMAIAASFLMYFDYR